MRRLPIVVAPTLGGLAILRYGVQPGIRLGLAASGALALLTLVLVSRIRLDLPLPPRPWAYAASGRSLPHSLRWLLASDILVRACEGMAGVFIILYAMSMVKRLPHPHSARFWWGSRW
ncbi:MAG: hypothetical protein R3E98_18675 [Gemmatimonadota bacterium]